METSSLDELTAEQVNAYKSNAIHRSVRRKSVPIIAKGDSWFDFLPGTDVIDCLRSRHDFTIRNYAKAGDTLENMILGSATDEDGRVLPPGISLALADVRQIKPGYFLFSGGGNDVAGDEFSTFLNHGHSRASSRLREAIVDHMIDEVFYEYISTLVSKVVEANERTVVVMHGYGHAQPSGKGVGFFGLNFAGPWLLPSLRRKGIDTETGAALVKLLIDRYNAMLQRLEKESAGMFRYIDLRSIVGPTDWRDELHLKNSAYARVADHIATALT